MKYMTNSAARGRCKKQVRDVFNALKIKDGLIDKAADGEFSYWYNKSRSGEIGNYIIYEVLGSEAMYRADDAVISREISCQVDVFSNNSLESKMLIAMLTQLEEKLEVAGFEVSVRSESYEPDTKLYHLVLIITKLYF